MSASETDGAEARAAAAAAAADGGESASNSRRDPLIGSVVNGKYRVVSAIARGGMGRIYYATQVPLERPVALKVVQGDGEQEHESQFLKRFLQEASILAKLQHPNVVTLFDYGRIENSHVEQYFIAMEFLAGETLANRLKARGRLAPAEVLVLGRQIIRGLREAHKRGVVHRDLKPSNIILVPDSDGGEIVKLVDFGIGKVLGRPGDAQDLTQDGVFVGTPRYMAPEQFEGTAYPASDLYALGTILFQALAGQLPFDGHNMAELMVAKLARPVPTLRELAPDLNPPPALERLVFHLLARRPEDRPSMEDLASQFMACEEEVFGGSYGGHMTGNTGGSWPRAQYGTSSSRPHPASDPSSHHRMTGSVPAIPSSHAPHGELRGPHGEPLRVPHTMVGALPNLAQLTPRPMAALAQAPAPPAQRSRVALVLVPLLFGAIAVGGFGVWWKMRPPAVEPTQVATPTSANAPATPATERPAPTFTLTIDSSPPGAAVFDGETQIGTTPLSTSLDRAAVAATPKAYTLKKDGYVATQIVQGPTTEAAAHTTVTLAADPSAGGARKTAGGALGGKPGDKAGSVTTAAKATATPPTATATQPGLDIRLKR